MQRLTTAPPWRHAPRFFLSGRVEANPRAERGVSGQKHGARGYGKRAPAWWNRGLRTRGPQGLVSAGAARRTPPGRR
ncbi:hypothetical protein C3488_03330 [Streptomyces sp. Ru72]|nr:hypothetical protein C3488_03330 [Streptomyces sp. Ru72]